MFFSPSAVLAFFITLFFVGQVAAAPRPMGMMERAAIERSLKRQTPDVQSPSKSDGGAVLPYKRQTPDVQSPSKSDGGAVLAYKRQTPEVQSPSKSDGGAILPYKRYAEIPSQLAVRSVNGVIELY